MSILDRGPMEAACRQVMSHYLVSVDRKDIPELLKSFAPTAVWLRPGMSPMNGHQDIQAFFEAIFSKQAISNAHGHLTRHLLTTLAITPVDERHVHGVSYALVY